MPDVYPFSAESRKTLNIATFSTLGDTAYLDELKNAKESLADLISGGQKAKLEDRGYVVQISGAYGVGKTTASWALVNEIAKDLGDSIFFIERSLIPFGNTTEAITSFLNSLAFRLWKEGVADIRKDIQQFIFEVTPSSEPVNVGASIGPISLGRAFSSRSRPISVTEGSIRDKLTRLAKKKIIILLDDLDRLQQEEIIQIMRMVEKLRSLPNVIIILPIYKRIIVNAFAGVMSVNNADAPTFLRKLTDFEVFLEADIGLLKRIFTESLPQSTVQLGGMPVQELCWYMLLHNIIITEALATIGDSQNGNDIRKVFDLARSPYLHRLKDTFYRHTHNITQEPHDTPSYPSHFSERVAGQNHDSEFFVPLGVHYQSISNVDSDTSTTAIQLAEMRNAANVMKLITTDHDTQQAMYQPGRIAFDAAVEARSSSPALLEVFVSILKQSNEEPYLTDNYRPRDILDISRRIQGDHGLDLSANADLAKLYLIVRQAFDRSR